MLRTDTWPNDKQAHIDDHRAMHKRYNAEYSAADYGSIQAAIDAAQAAGGGCVFVPPGEHRISESLVVSTSGIHLRGVGRASQIVNESARPSVIVRGTAERMAENVELDHLWIVGGANGAIGSAWSYALHPRIFMCGFRNCGGYGIQLGPEIYNTAITHSVIQGCKQGGIKLGTNVHQVSLMGSRAQGNWGPGIDGRTGRSYGLYVAGNVIEGNRNAAYLCDETSSVQGISFIGNYFEKNNHYEPKGPQIDLGADGRGYVIVGNYFWGSHDDSTHAVLVRRGSCGIIAANSMLRHSGRDVEIQAAATQWLVFQIPDLSTADAPINADEEGLSYDTIAQRWHAGGGLAILGDDGGMYQVRVDAVGALYAQQVT